MNTVSVPVIKNPATKKTKSSKNTDYTKITFQPDLEKFGIDSPAQINNILEDLSKIITRRMYDIAGCVAPIAVTLNNQPINVKSFHDYVKLFSITNPVNNQSPDTDKIFYLDVNSRWSVAVRKSNTGEFESMSFVNSIWTSRYFAVCCICDYL